MRFELTVLVALSAVRHLCRRRCKMRPERAIEELKALRSEGNLNAVLDGGQSATAWKAKVRAVLVSALGSSDNLIEKFDKVRYSLIAVSSSTQKSA